MARPLYEKEHIIRKNAEQWETCTDPLDLLLSLSKYNLSDRKTRLIACMIARQRWSSIGDVRHNECILVGERYADHTGTDILTRDLRECMADALRVTALFEQRREILDRKENDELMKVGRLCQACVRIDISTLLQRSIERARKCEISDNVLCGITRDLVGNPFTSKPEVMFPCSRSIKDKAQELYNNPNELGQIDSVDLALMTDKLEDEGFECELVLNTLRKECPYCKYLGEYQGNRFQETDLEGNLSIPPKSIRDHTGRECICKGTRLARHWKGNWVIDLLIGKN